MWKWTATEIKCGDQQSPSQIGAFCMSTQMWFFILSRKKVYVFSFLRQRSTNEFFTRAIPTLNFMLAFARRSKPFQAFWKLRQQAISTMYWYCLHFGFCVSWSLACKLAGTIGGNTVTFLLCYLYIPSMIAHWTINWWQSQKMHTQSTIYCGTMYLYSTWNQVQISEIHVTSQ